MPFLGYKPPGNGDSRPLIGPCPLWSKAPWGADLAARLETPPVLVTDALPSYVEGVQWVFGRAAKHTMSKSGTSYVERHNLTIRMGNRRFTRRTNGFSKKFECHATHLHLHLQLWHYNFMRSHLSLDGATPAMAAGVAPCQIGWRDLLATIPN